MINLATGIPPADLPQFDSRMQFAHLTKLNPGLMRWLQQMTEPNPEFRFGRAAEALKALETNELAINNTNNDIPYTPVFIRKSLDKLEIDIPTNQNVIELLFGGSALLLWILFILTSGGTASIWVGWLFFIFGASIIAWLTLPGFVENNICFNNKKFEIKWKLFGVTFMRKRGNVLNIEKIYIYKTGGIGRNRVSEIILSVGVDEYSFGRLKKGLTKKESQCIALEIRNWLGI